jgi:hypothetical protein
LSPDKSLSSIILVHDLHAFGTTYFHKSSLSLCVSLSELKKYVQKKNGTEQQEQNLMSVKNV